MTRIDANWLKVPAVQTVFVLLQDAGFQALAVGGCVRNALLNAPINDIDIATNARPKQVMGLAQKAGLQVVPTGIEHGTVTVVVDGHPFEVTTFRKDVETDGRRAVVAFADTIVEDAIRRDFTMNALYVKSDGQVLDPLGGLDDLWARQVRFIQDPGQRIREDYLRSLRFFRFHAWYGDPSRGLDAEALAAIASHLDGLEGLSRERVGSEIVKLLSANDPAPAVAAMRSTGVLAQVLPGANDRMLAPLVHLEQGLSLPPEPMRRLAALSAGEATATLRLSRAEMRRLKKLSQTMIEDIPPGELGYRHGAQMALDVLALRAAATEQPIAEGAIAAAQFGAEQVFPLKAADLVPAFNGRALGAELKRREQQWIDSGFQRSRDELLKR